MDEAVTLETGDGGPRSWTDHDYHSDSLPGQLQTKAQAELNEDPERIMEDIRLLRHLIQADYTLVAPVDARFLVKFLRARKFNVEKAFKLLQRYYLLRANHSDLFRDLRPSLLRNVFRENLQGFLSGTDKEQRAVFLFRGGAWDPTKVSAEDIFRTNLLCLELALQNPANQVRGIVALVDVEGLGLQHLRHASPSYMMKVVSLIQDCFPARFQAIHIVKESRLIDVILAIVKPFLKTKLKERIHLHGYNLQRLHHHISPHVLPKEYGGYLEAFNNRDWVRQLVDNEEMFVELMKYGYVTTSKSE